MNYMQPFGADMVGIGGWPTSLFIILMAWSLFWKGLALWHSAKRGEKWWFIAILLINTAGILEIFYLFVIAKKKFSTLLGEKIEAREAQGA